MDAIAARPFLVDVFAKFGMQGMRIFNIIDSSEYRYRRRGKLTPVFLHNRIMEPLYNIPCTLLAFQIIQQRYPDARLTSRTMVRASPSSSVRQATAIAQYAVHRPRAACPNRRALRLSGHLPHQPQFRLHARLLLECYASGLPVIATNTGGIPYIATDEETALLFPRDDHEAMAARAFRLLEDEALVERLTAKAYESTKKYSREQSRDGWFALYRQLMGYKNECASW